MRANSKTNLTIAIIFTVSIFLPLIWLAFQGLNTNSNIQEKRTLAAVPSFNLKDVSSYPGQFEDFFNDHFGLREKLINLNNFIRIKVFNSSGSPNVLVGKEGWLFLNGAQAKEGNTIANHLGLMPFGYKEMFRDFKNNLEQKRNYLEKLGIRYLFVIAPSKWTIYPEYLPEGFENPDRKSSIDLLVEYLRNNTDVEIIDLRKTIAEAKHLGKPLFYKKDTHWNTMGAFFGYQEIAKKASLYFPSIKPRSINDFDLYYPNP